MSNGKNETKRLVKKKTNDCFWMEIIFCLESHIHLCSRHTSANPAYVIKTCLTWHAFSGARYWGFVSPKLHVSTYRNQQHCWWFHNGPFNEPASFDIPELIFRAKVTKFGILVGLNMFINMSSGFFHSRQKIFFTHFPTSHMENHR